MKPPKEPREGLDPQVPSPELRIPVTEIVQKRMDAEVAPKMLKDILEDRYKAGKTRRHCFSLKKGVQNDTLFLTSFKMGSKWAQCVSTCLFRFLTQDWIESKLSVVGTPTMTPKERNDKSSLFKTGEMPVMPKVLFEDKRRYFSFYDIDLP